MNVSIDVLDIHELNLPRSVSAVAIILGVAMMVYILTTFLALWQMTKARQPPVPNKSDYASLDTVSVAPPLLPTGPLTTD